MRRRIVRGGLALLAAAGWLVLAPAAGQAAGTGSGTEQVTRFDIDLTLAQDGTMHVHERLDYDLGPTGHHGITQQVQTQFEYGTDGTHYREYPLSDVKASSPSGAPADVDVSKDGPLRTIRIGDPDRGDITGPQVYEIDFDVKGVLNGFDDQQQLYWNPIGQLSDVPISNVTVTVSGPAAIFKSACYQGRDRNSSRDCPTKVSKGKATYTADRLEPGEQISVVAGFPPGTFSSTAPIVREKWSLAKAFELTPETGVGSVALFGALAGGVGMLVARKGRDEQYLSVTPGLEPGLGQDTGVTRVGMRRAPVAVQFQPPAGMRPGQLGTLIDEQANVVDVTATIVDLAVRGFLRIEEIEKEGWFKSGDWRLVMIWPAPTDELHDYEMKLLKAIFDDRQEVLLSDLKQHFASDLSSVQSMLYADVTRQGWFRGNPSSVRTAWQFAAGALVVAGAGLTWLLAAKTHFGLVGVAVVLAGIVGLILAPRMPARTAKGTALLAQAKGFELYLSKAEANQIKWEEGQDIFSRYLPYAIVFGVAERWAKVFQDLAESGANLVEPSWYVGSAYGHGLFNYYAFSGAMDNFATTTSGSISAPTPSSSGGSGFGSGGFAGGGGGGGGVGSW